MMGNINVQLLAEAFSGVLQTAFTFLDEHQRRLVTAVGAMLYGYGGIKLMADLSGINEKTIRSGICEIENDDSVLLDPGERVRASGAGRKPIKEIYPEFLDDIREILENNTYGDPEKIISWTNLSAREISNLLKERYSIEAGVDVILRALDELGYSRQTNRKMLQVGEEHPNRDAQFQYINQKAADFIRNGEPVISVDAKKKELVGNFKNPGTEYRPIKNPRLVYDHDFMINELGKVVPYGIYTVNTNKAFINLGTCSDTSEFAVESIRRWWNTVGKYTFPNAKCLYINCDCGGSNGYRVRLWKYELAKFAEETGLAIHVSHLPPGTSKWNKVEHRVFCYISKNWEGKPLINIETIISLISSTKTSKGLEVKCVSDETPYQAGIKISDEEMLNIDIEMIGENAPWNYIIRGFKKGK